jgi:hypothetical protein
MAKFFVDKERVEGDKAKVLRLSIKCKKQNESKSDFLTKMSKSHLPVKSKLDLDLEHSLRQPEEEKKGVILSKNTETRNL